MDTLVGDLTQLVDKHLDVISSVLFGKTENFDLIGNKKWMVYYINSDEAGFYKILETLDLKTLKFLETHEIKNGVDFDIFTETINRMLSLGLEKHTVRYTLREGSKNIDHDRVEYLLRKLIKTRKHNKVIITLTQLVLGKRDQNGDVMDMKKIIEDVYHYGDQTLIQYYEQSVYRDDLHFRHKFIGLVKSGQNVDELIQRFAGDGYHVELDRHLTILDLLKHQHYNNIVVRLLAQCDGNTIEDQIKTVFNSIDGRLNLIYLYYRTLNNIEMCKILIKIASEQSNIKILKIMLGGAIRNNKREIYDLITTDHPELKFSISLENSCAGDTKTNVELLKYVLDQRGGLNQQERQTMIRLLLEDCNIHLLEFIQNY